MDMRNKGKAPHVKGDKNRKRLSNLFVRYRIPYEKGAKLIEKLKNGKCEICGQTKKLFIDHNHKTNKIRGYLCPMCNSVIGWFREDIKVFNKAISYIKKHK